MKLSWPDLTLPPINLWSVPARSFVEYKEFVKNKRKVYAAKLIRNPWYDVRRHG